MCSTFDLTSSVSLFSVEIALGHSYFATLTGPPYFLPYLALAMKFAKVVEHAYWGVDIVFMERTRDDGADDCA